MKNQPNAQNPRPRVVIGHPFIGRGGSEARVMWLIEALKHDYDVTVATTGGWNLEALNQYYGTGVQEQDVQVRLAPFPSMLQSRSVSALRGGLMQRFARRIAPEYDLRLSAYNPMDWGLPAVHFLADFTWNGQITRDLDPQPPGFVYRNTPLRKLYLSIAKACSNRSQRDVLREDLLIANSRWADRIMRKYFSVACAGTVYPSVWTEFPLVPWEEKQPSFVMIGRIAPEKRIEDAIAILDQLRDRGYNAQLRLCGAIGEDPYGQLIRALCQQRADWIQCEGRVSGDKKLQILTHCKYGIQTRGAEPFGIAVAEMVKAGALVFTTNDGGQCEIVDHPDLLFTDVQDAANKIAAVLDSEEKQIVLRRHLTKQGELFSSRHFMESARRVVREALHEPAETLA